MAQIFKTHMEAYTCQNATSIGELPTAWFAPWKEDALQWVGQSSKLDNPEGRP